MNAKELRIGNYVIVNSGTDITGKIDSIYDADELTSVIGVKTKDWHFTLVIEHVIQIPLTEEWLGMFGFEPYNGWINTYSNGILTVELNHSKTRWYETKNNIPIDSVNNLQNLYFALTGTELTIK